MRQDGRALRPRILGLLLLQTALLFLSGGLQATQAERTPSTDLTFHLSLAPDSITVGDPIRVEIAGSAPEEGVLLFPTFADSIGPFAVLDAPPLVREISEGRVRIEQQLEVTLYRTGESILPGLPLLWIPDSGDTMVAYTSPKSVWVASLLPADADLSSPESTLGLLRDLKEVISLRGLPWLRWLLIAAIAAVALLTLWLLIRRWRGRKPVEPVVRPRRVRPKLRPEVAFEKGLGALFEQKFLEQGEIKEFYAGLSLLLREYLEGRYEITAVEETRSEILTAIAAHPGLNDQDRRWLADWLAEGDLVKFAKMDRLLAEAKDAAETARGWVGETTRRIVAAVRPGEAPS